METTSNVINSVIANVRKKIQEEKPLNSTNNKVCPICNGTGMQRIDYNTYKKCKCAELDHVRNLWEKSDMPFDSINKTWANYNPITEDQQDMKNTVTNYFLNFDKIKNNESNSLMLLGQSGSGKTHLLTATAYKFIKEKQIAVMYMPFIDVLTKLKQLKMKNPDEYQKEINKYKNAKLLFIDDLFKGKTTEADLLITFEIINFRINKRLPLMISSESSIDDLKYYDNAIAGRMFNASKCFLMQVFGEENDYRLKDYYAAMRS